MVVESTALSLAGILASPSDEELLEDEVRTIRRQQVISPPPFLPTKAQIRAACRQIQASWSPAEERSRRMSGHTVRWNLPGAKSALIVAREDAAQFH
ncbi:MAG TPA: hypothetical protein VM165_02685 [Planctomycetaceae bacterium]|nr:hypothetical protein [Planctomycetaceae bacterium]